MYTVGLKSDSLLRIGPEPFHELITSIVLKKNSSLFTEVASL